MGGDLAAFVRALEDAARQKDPRAAFFGVEPVDEGDGRPGEGL